MGRGRKQARKASTAKRNVRSCRDLQTEPRLLGRLSGFAFEREISARAEN